MSHYRAGLALLAACVALAACDITQQHIDEVSERLAQATVAVGDPPTQSQISAGENLRASHLAGSSWRIVEVGKWPHASAVVTLGTNGRTVWHVGESRFLQWHHWRVTGGRLQFSEDASWRRTNGEGVAGLRIDRDTVCFEFNGTCGGVLQRVTP